MGPVIQKATNPQIKKNEIIITYWSKNVHATFCKKLPSHSIHFTLEKCVPLMLCSLIGLLRFCIKQPFHLDCCVIDILEFLSQELPTNWVGFIVLNKDFWNYHYCLPTKWIGIVVQNMIPHSSIASLFIMLPCMKRGGLLFLN